MQIIKNKRKRARGHGKAVLEDTASGHNGIEGQNMPGSISKGHLPMMIPMEEVPRFHLTSALSGSVDEEHACMVSTKSAGTMYESRPSEPPAAPLNAPNVMHNARPGMCVTRIGMLWNERSKKWWRM